MNNTQNSEIGPKIQFLIFFLPGPNNQIPTGNRRLLHTWLTGYPITGAGWRKSPTGYPSFSYQF